MKSNIMDNPENTKFEDLTLDELKTILEEASDGDLFYCGGTYLNKNLDIRSRIVKYTVKGKVSNFYYARPFYTDMSDLHLLSDIENIVKLKEHNKKAYQCYVRLEGIKQRYNGENKIKKQLLEEAVTLLSYGSPQECNQLAILIEETLNEHSNANN